MPLQTTSSLSIRRLDGSFILGELMKDSESLVNLSGQSIGGLEEVKKLRIVHLEQHSGDLAGQFGLGPNVLW
jgi:hypothetical protein